MLLNKTSLTVPQKIRRLLKKYNVGVFFVRNSKFQYLLKKQFKESCLSSKTIAVALPPFRMIIINSELVLRLNFTQKELNYMYLHEFAHAGKWYLTEKEAHKCALRFSRYYKIPINYLNYNV